MNVTDNTGRQHRTALFVDARDLSKFEERANRLLQSLNGQNIKVDVFSVRPGNGNGGVVRVTGSPGSLAVDFDSVVDFDASELSAWAKSKGYEMVLFAAPAGAELA